jgi:hypothetical protein
MRPDEAEVEFAAASAAATTPPQRARALLARAHVLVFILDRGDEGRALLDRQGVDAAGEPVPEAVAFRSSLVTGAGDVTAGAAMAASVIATPGASPQARTWASWAAAYGAAFLGGDTTACSATRRVRRPPCSTPSAPATPS